MERSGPAGDPRPTLTKTWVKHDVRRNAPPALRNGLEARRETELLRVHVEGAWIVVSS